MEILITIGYIALCVLFFSLAIAIHEFGHFIVALKLGLKVERFSIGFGPAIVKKTWRGVEYRLSWIPLGGYVMIPDVDPEGTKKLEGGEDGKKEPGRGRKEVPAWKEIAVAVAGPGMNLVLAVVLAFTLAAIPSVKFGELPAKIAYTLKGGPAEKAGLQANDIITAVNGKEISGKSDLSSIIADCAAGDKLTLSVYRQGQTLTVTVTVGEQTTSALANQQQRQQSQQSQQQQTMPDIFGFGG